MGERYAVRHPEVRTFVLDGSGVRCRGCGRDEGVATVAIVEGWEPPPERVFPFDPDDCPVCWLTDVVRNGPIPPEKGRPSEGARGKLP